MADNVTLPASGAVIGTDNIGGVQFQRVKLDIGVEGVSTPVNTANYLPVIAQAIYNSSPPSPLAGGTVPLQTDSAGNLKTNPRLLTNVDTVSVQNLSAAQLFATVWINDGAGNALASYSPGGGGTNLLKVANADTRSLYQQGTSNTINANGNSGDLLTYNVRYLALDINVGTATGTSPTLTFFLDRKGFDGIYYQLVSFTAFTTSVKTGVWHIGPGCTTNIVLGYTMRLRWTISGASASFPNASINLYQQT
jgi:hypothetical protein